MILTKNNMGVGIDIVLVSRVEKILNSKIEIFATCVRVPVFVGHAESVFVETKKKIDFKK